ncbi:MAG: ATP-binding cassette domain-containing protein [bacterium]|nr:ATP-binding cassette domain-containing protein [bacterium]
MIRIQNVTKYYGARLAVDDISFEVQKGETVGFLGPNAAGKTTTMRIINGYLMPTRGDVWIADYNMASHSLDGRRLIGYLPEMVPLYTDMTTRAYLKYAARLRGLSRSRTRSRVDEVVEQCGLQEYIGVTLAKLSKGFKQRVGLAQAIIHDPEVLILDEPTIGIDPIQVAQTRQLIRQLGKNRTILLSTHILPEISMICERIIIIHEGRIVARDSIENLSAILSGGNRLHLKIQGDAGKVTERLEQIDSIQSVTYDSPNHIVEFAANRQPHTEIMEAVVQNGWTLLAMESAEMDLEDIFLRLTTRAEAES